MEWVVVLGYAATACLIVYNFLCMILMSSEDDRAVAGLKLIGCFIILAALILLTVDHAGHVNLNFGKVLG